MPGREVIYTFLDQGDLAVADGMLDDCWDVAIGRFEPWCTDGLPTWTEDPYNERYWRFVFYSLRPTAHLLWAWRETGDRTYLDKLLDILESYIDAAPDCPWLGDPHGTAFRAMVLVNTYRKLEQDGELPDALASDLRREIRLAGAYLADPRHFESHYNHGLNQAAALLLVGEEFPGGDGCDGDWRDLALERLDQVMEEIVYPDGVEVEMSPRYHFYVMTMAWEVDHWAREYGVPISQTVADQVQAMVAYAAWVTQPDGRFPLIGSSTVGDIREYRPWVLEEIAATDPLFEHTWTAGVSGQAPEDHAVLFPDSGQWMARAGSMQPEDYALQTHLVFDVGPRRTSHAQYDALSLHLYADGRPVLPDSGLYTYESGTRHSYFFGSTSHSTVIVDGLSQMDGHAAPGLTALGEEWAYQSGSHDLFEGVHIWRAVLLLGPGRVLVLDRVQSQDEHRYSQLWQLAPGALAQGDVAGVVVSDGQGASLQIIQGSTGDLELELFEGADDPMQGWHSDEYEMMVPSPTLEYRAEASEALFATLLVAEPGVGAPTFAAWLDPDLMSIDLEIGDRSWFIDVADPGGPDEAVQIDLEER